MNVQLRAFRMATWALIALITLIGCTPPSGMGAGGEASTTGVDLFTPVAPAPLEGETDPSEVIALVNGQPISMEAYRRELARWTAAYSDLGYEVADTSAYQAQVLDLLIERELVRQRAEAEGVVVTDQEVDAELASLIQEAGEENYQTWLLANLLTQEEFHELTQLEMLTRRLIGPVEAAIPDVAEQVHARHILVNTELEAVEILGRLQAGEDFDALAAEYSLDMTSARVGGDIGWFPRGGLLVSEVEEAAFNLAPGQLSGVIASPWGYHIVQTLEYDPARPIDSDIRQQLLEHAVQAWFDDLQAGADIQILVEDLPG